MIASAVVLFTSCEKDDAPKVNAIVKASSGDSAGVVTKMNEFRLLAGDPVNTAPGVTLQNMPGLIILLPLA